MRCEIWSAVFRKGYPEDLIFFHNEWEGRDVAELTILFFDKAGRPYPWQATGEWTLTGKGVEQLALDTASGNAQLVYPVREGDQRAALAYVYKLFRITPEGIAEVVSAEKSGPWPAVSGDRSALVGTERNRTETELFATPKLKGGSRELTLRSVLPLSSEKSLVYSDGTRTRYPAMVVIDKADGSRRMFLSDNTLDAVQQIAKGSYRLHVQGSTCEEEECRPFLLFAQEPFAHKH